MTDNLSPIHRRPPAVCAPCGKTIEHGTGRVTIDLPFMPRPDSICESCWFELCLMATPRAAARVNQLLGVDR